VIRANWLLRLLLAPTTLVAALTVEPAAAQPPDVLQSFRLIPSRSTLDVTGGTANIQQKFFAYGRFGLNFGYQSGPHAEFLNVDSWLVPDSPLTFVWHTDGTLNLSGLEGTFAASDPSRIVFQGVDGQGLPLQLTATQRGRLLHVVGENQPPCCGFLKYKFDALAHAAPYADFNLDGMVDEQDAYVLASNIGTFAHATLEQGDADGDGDVDGNDFLAWQREIGAATPMSAFAAATPNGAALGSVAVPEPMTMTICLTAATAILVISRYRRA
jgi:hypothetical protein